jgi:hypothetical protein
MEVVWSRAVERALQNRRRLLRVRFVFLCEGIGMTCRNRLQDLVAKTIRELTSRARKVECGSRERLRNGEEADLERALNA